MSGQIQAVSSYGVINRLRGSIIVPSYPVLNINYYNLGRRGIDMAREEPTTDVLEQMAGVVNSPAPYLIMTLTAQLVRTQGLSAAWESQLQTNTVLGNIVFHSDTTIQGVNRFRIRSASLRRAAPLPVSGEDASYVIVISGVYDINSSLYSL